MKGLSFFYEIDKEKFYFEKLELVTKKTLSFLKGENPVIKKNLHARSISIIFVSNNKIEILNEKYRNIKKICKSLVFNYNKDSDVLESEIFICLPYIFKESEKGKFINNYQKVIIHCFLHVAGFHHKTKKEFNDMWDMQDCFFGKLGVDA